MTGIRMPSLCSMLLLLFLSPVDGRSHLGAHMHYHGSKLYGDPLVDLAGVEHQHAYAYVTGDAYYGTNATFSLWDPYVELQNEFSLAQLWLLAQNPDDNNSISTLEAGWQVFPSQYGDNNPRLFVYWTSDGYNNTGCYNLECDGFVQTSTNLIPGKTVLSPVSTMDGSAYEFTLYVFRDTGTGNWLLYFNDEQIGYWPQNLSYLTSNSISEVQWGGEIVNREPNGQHTATQMGSGNFAEAGYKEAAYIRSLQWVDVQNNIQNVDISTLIPVATNVTCYNIMANNDDNWGTYFYFGGPGRNPNCP